MLKTHKNSAGIMKAALLCLSIAALQACSEQASDDAAQRHAGAGVTNVPKQSAEQRARIGQMADAWKEQPLYSVPYDAIDPAVTLENGGAVSLFDANDEYWGLPRSGGDEELVASYCSACHSLRIVMQQHATKERWDEILDWMVEKQNMQPLAPEERATVLSYLSEYFSN